MKPESGRKVYECMRHAAKYIVYPELINEHSICTTLSTYSETVIKYQNIESVKSIAGGQKKIAYVMSFSEISSYFWTLNW